MFEQVKGRAKEALGDLTNNPDLQREGEAQAEDTEPAQADNADDAGTAEAEAAADATPTD